MKLKLDRWEKITISQYYTIVGIVEDPDLSTQEKNIKLVAFLCQEPEEEVALLPAIELNTLVSQTTWLGSFNFNYKHCPRKIVLGKKKFRVILEPAKLTTAQYLDFRNFYSYGDLKQYYGNLLACFVIPEEAKGYGDGYDPLELAKELYENLGIQEANTLMFFFLRKLALSIKIMVTYSEYLLKRAVKKDPNNPALREALEKMKSQVLQLTNLISGTRS